MELSVYPDFRMLDLELAGARRFLSIARSGAVLSLTELGYPAYRPRADGPAPSHVVLSKIDTAHATSAAHLGTARFAEFDTAIASLSRDNTIVTRDVREVVK